MTGQEVVFLFNNLLSEGLVIIAPLLGVALVVGLAISLVQAITQIQEVNLVFIPKILAIAITLRLMSDWMMEKMVTLSVEIYSRVAGI